VALLVKKFEMLEYRRKKEILDCVRVLPKKLEVIMPDTQI